jgi:hypothetical protein
MNDLIKILNNPEEHYPGNFDTPQRANALLTGLCQDAANEIAKLQAEVLEQCRINGMSAEREDALRAELTRLKASIALDKMAENARELGLDYEPAPVQEPWVGLTDEERDAITVMRTAKWRNRFRNHAKAVEQLLKEKNHDQ